MKFSRYIKDKFVLIVGLIFMIISIFLMGYAFKAKRDYMIALALLMVLTVIAYVLSDYLKRRHFYNNMENVLEGLDQKYLITDMITAPEFAEGELLMEMLYDIDKSMKENINVIEKKSVDFKEYLEIWIHEIKVPISALGLMNYNQNTDFNKQKEQIDKVNYFVEQILFYARADESEKDYLMKKVTLDNVINKVVMDNKMLLIGNKIAVEKGNTNVAIVSDSKWLEFMVNQLVNNAIKYKSEEKKPKIRFEVFDDDKETILVIEDNGIGISNGDLPHVFDKTFTGENGRKRAASTGMGLYICKKLCNKLGHKIAIESVRGEYTRVTLVFGKDAYYNL